jgi:hypothetical protein
MGLFLTALGLLGIWALRSTRRSEEKKMEKEREWRRKQGLPENIPYDEADPGFYY